MANIPRIADTAGPVAVHKREVDPHFMLGMAARKATKIEPAMMVGTESARRPDILLIMVPGMSMDARDMETKGLIGAVGKRDLPVSIAIVDPGPDSYLDNSVEIRLLEGIAEARHATGSNRIWLAGISLGCQAILRCVRRRPDFAEGLILLTPYLASTGLIAEITRAGGIRPWSLSKADRNDPERALLTWLATIPLGDLPRILVGRALSDRFAATANLLADLLPADQVTSVPGGHDWASWRVLWNLILDQNPFERMAAGAP
jgi:pimeloyl-ACP methyl ester carboxylesterase